MAASESITKGNLSLLTHQKSKTMESWIIWLHSTFLESILEATSHILEQNFKIKNAHIKTGTYRVPYGSLAQQVPSKHRLVQLDKTRII